MPASFCFSFFQTVNLIPILFLTLAKTQATAQSCLEKTKLQSSHHGLHGGPLAPSVCSVTGSSLKCVKRLLPSPFFYVQGVCGMCFVYSCCLFLHVVLAPPPPSLMHRVCGCVVCPSPPQNKDTILLESWTVRWLMSENISTSSVSVYVSCCHSCRWVGMTAALCTVTMIHVIITVHLDTLSPFSHHFHNTGCFDVETCFANVTHLIN